MKTIVLYDIDGKIPNLALMKLSSYYKNQGCHVLLSKKLDYITADAYFASFVFYSEKSLALIAKLKKIYGSRITIGGTGYDIAAQLPFEIDNCFPDYSLYPQHIYAIGFLTRGCTKVCRFCVVPQKEGKLNREYASFDNFVPAG